MAIVEGLKRRGVNVFSAKDDFLRIALNNPHLGIIYVHQQKLTIGECIKKLKIIVETRTMQELENQILFL
jgi:hypothetical protein